MSLLLNILLQTATSKILVIDKDYSQTIVVRYRIRMAAREEDETVIRAGISPLLDLQHSSYFENTNTKTYHKLQLPKSSVQWIYFDQENIIATEIFLV